MYCVDYLFLVGQGVFVIEVWYVWIVVGGFVVDCCVFVDDQVDVGGGVLVVVFDDFGVGYVVGGKVVGYWCYYYMGGQFQGVEVEWLEQGFYGGIYGWIFEGEWEVWVGIRCGVVVLGVI